MAGLVTLKIVLRDIKPKIWRRVLVPDDFTFAELHSVIQGAMGWHDKHLHHFEIDGAYYDVPDGEGSPRGRQRFDERKFTLAKLLKPGMDFVYLYDFGDDWRHDITVEGSEAMTGLMSDGSLALCLDGARASPPEDCGGPYAYPELLAALKNKRHPEHANAVQWAGKFDPETFSIPQATSLIFALLALEAERAAARARLSRRSSRSRLQ
jgi:hypothetical protein